MEQNLSAELLEGVLQKFGFSDYPQSDINGLRAIYKAWCQKVPFDNVRKLIHVSENNPAVLPGDNATDFFQAWLTHGTGGTCWSGNGALHDLLQSLGFNVSRGVATMLVTPDLPPNHGTVLVECDGATFVVDASILHRDPLPINGNDEAQGFPHNIKLSNRDGRHYIWWQPLHLLAGIECRIDKTSATLEEFQQRHELTRAWSPFNYQLTVRLIGADSVVGVGAGHWVEIDSLGEATQTNISAEQRRKLMVDRLGMSEEIVDKLPADRPTPPPPWSKTAQKAAQNSGS